MAIDIRKEKLVSCLEASEYLPGNPASSTIWRWTRFGFKEVKLEFVRVGHKMYTSIEALDRFVNALAAADQRAQASIEAPCKTTQVSSAARRAELRRADEILTRDGILQPQK